MQPTTRSTGAAPRARGAVYLDMDERPAYQHTPDAHGVDEGLLDLAAAGTDLAAALVGGAVGSIGGPPGIAAGAAASVALSHGARAVVGRFRARQKIRVGAALNVIAADADQRSREGQNPRDDGFFDDRDGLRSDAEDLLEAVLDQAANAYDERKVALLARFYSAVAHQPSVPADTAKYLVPLAGELTYRQYVALAVFSNHRSHEGALVRAEGHHETGSIVPEAGLLAELDDLGDRRLLGITVKGRVRVMNEVIGASAAMRATRWSNIRPSSMGDLLARLTGADRLPIEDRTRWIAALDRPKEQEAEPR